MSVITDIIKGVDSYLYYLGIIVITNVVAVAVNPQYLDAALVTIGIKEAPLVEKAPVSSVDPGQWMGTASVDKTLKLEPTVPVAPAKPSKPIEVPVFSLADDGDVLLKGVSITDVLYSVFLFISVIAISYKMWIDYDNRREHRQARKARSKSSADCDETSPGQEASDVRKASVVKETILEAKRDDTPSVPADYLD